MLDCGQLLVKEGDPLTSLLCDALSSPSRQTQTSAGATDPSDLDTAHALSSLRKPFLALYKHETFALEDLPPRHSLSVLADAVYTIELIHGETPE